MTETSSSLISALGAGTGVDFGKLATELSTAQYEKRIEQLNSKSDVLEQQISTASSLKNSLSQLASAIGSRVRVGDLSGQPSVVNSSVAAASSPLGTVGKGTYTLEVLQLAAAQTLSTPAVADATAVVGAGSLTFRFGTTTGSSFTEDADQEALTVDIESGASLNDIAAAINAKGASVSAYVAQTAAGAQLVLKGAEGAQNGFIVEATETPGEEGLAALAWDPTAGGASSRLLATSGDASFKLDGLDMTSASNDVGVVAPGLQLTLTGTNAGNPTQVKFGDPSANIVSMMQDLVEALNEVGTDLRSATDPLNGDLARDPGARALRQAFQQLPSTVIMPNAPDGSPRTLAELGLTTQRDGSYTLDADRLAKVLEEDPEGVAAMFTPGLYGVFATVDGMSRAASKTGDPGSLAGSISRYTKQSSDLSDDLAEIAEKQEALRASLASRFTQAQTRISASQSTLSFLQSQIDVWNAQSGN